MPNNRIPLSPPPPPPMTTQPRSYFGGAWTTPIFLRPPLSSAPGPNANSGGLSRPHNDGIAGMPRGNPTINPNFPDIASNPRSNLSQLPGIENYRTVVQPDLMGGSLVYKLVSNGELLEITDTTGIFTTKSGKLLMLCFGSNLEKNFYFVRKSSSEEYHFYNERTDEIGPVIVQDQATGLWSLQHRQADAWYPPSLSLQLGPTNPQTLSSQPGPPTAPKHPLPPDRAPSLPPKRLRVAGGMNVAKMPSELVRGSGGFWHLKGQATQQSASNLFRDGKIYDVTYSDDGSDINGKFNYREEEYHFFYHSQTGSSVILRDMYGNIVTPFGESSPSFARFLNTLERKLALPLLPPPPAMPRSPIMMQSTPDNFRVPNELNPPAAGKFWDKADPYIQFFLTELYKNREIYGINFDSGIYGKPRLNAVMRYRGREYSFTVGMSHQVMFTSSDIPPGFHYRQGLHQTLEALAEQTLTWGPGPGQPYSKRFN